MFSSKNPGGVLVGDGRQCGSWKTTEREDRLDVCDDARTARRIETRDC
jgi:hypothetical protein